MKTNKKLTKLVLVLALAIGSLGVFGSITKAIHAEEVLTYYEVVTNSSGRYTSAQTYKTLKFTNGYTMKETSKDITSWGEKLLGNSHYAYYRTYSTY